MTSIQTKLYFKKENKQTNKNNFYAEQRTTEPGLTWKTKLFMLEL